MARNGRTTRSSCGRRSTPPSAPTWRSIRWTPAACRRWSRAAMRARPAAAAWRSSRAAACAAVRPARRVAGHADVAGRRHRRARVHRLQRFRRGVRAGAARHLGLLPARLQQHQPRAGRPLPAHPGAGEARGLRVEARNGYYAERDFAHTSGSDREAQLQEQLDSPPCRRPTCRCSCGRLVPAGRPTATTCRSRWRSRHGGAGERAGRRRSTCAAWCATSRAARSAACARRCRCRRTARHAGRQAGALSVGRDAAAGPLLGEGRRARERRRHDGLVRGADRRAGADADAAQGQLGRAQHAAAAGGRPGERREPADPRRRPARSPTSPASWAAIRSCTSTTRCTIRTPAGQRRDAHQPGVLSREGEGVRNAGRGATSSTAVDDGRRCSSSRCRPRSLTPGLYTCQINIVDAVAGRVAFPRLAIYVRP